MIPLTRVRTRRVLTWQGRLLIIGLFAAIGWFIVANLYPFLNRQDTPVGAILVVEGWMPRASLAAARERYAAGNYRRMLITGGRFNTGSREACFGTHAQMAASMLEEMGMHAPDMVPIPGPQVEQNRTYASARAIRAWLEANGEAGTPFDLFTQGVHARRSWLLYGMAFGEDWPFGVIAVPSPYYDPQRWWQTGDGVKDLLGETVGWLYAQFLFQPPASPESVKSG